MQVVVHHEAGLTGSTKSWIRTEVRLGKKVPAWRLRVKPIT